MHCIIFSLLARIERKADIAIFNAKRLRRHAIEEHADQFEMHGSVTFVLDPHFLGGNVNNGGCKYTQTGRVPRDPNTCDTVHGHVTNGVISASVDGFSCSGAP